MAWTRHITVKPSITQTLSLQLSAVKGMEEELGSNMETLGECSLTNTASVVATFSLLWVFACRDVCGVSECQGRRMCHLILSEVAAGSPGSSPFHCRYVSSIMPELQKEL